MSLDRFRNGMWQTGFFIIVVVLAVWAVNKSRESAQHSQALFNQSQLQINEKIVQSQLDACEHRGHVLRAQVNYTTDLIRQFMQAAVKAASLKPGAANQARARLYQRLADGLKDVPQPNCSSVIFRPGKGNQ